MCHLHKMVRLVYVFIEVNRTLINLLVIGRQSVFVLSG